MKAMLIAGALLLASAAAQASTIIPVYSESSFSNAAYNCRSRGGNITGMTMETTTATYPDFYVVACARQNWNRITETVAWSANSYEDAEARCETDSVTTGLPAGEPIGVERHLTPSQPDIFIVICKIP